MESVFEACINKDYLGFTKEMGYESRIKHSQHLHLLRSRFGLNRIRGIRASFHSGQELPSLIWYFIPFIWLRVDIFFRIGCPISSPISPSLPLLQGHILKCSRVLFVMLPRTLDLLFLGSISSQQGTFTHWWHSTFSYNHWSTLSSL